MHPSKSAISIALSQNLYITSVMPNKRCEMMGMRFGRLVVIKEAPSNNPRILKWLCRCDCGVEKPILGYQLRNGRTRSCGCYRREQKSEQMKRQATRHGLSRTYFSQIWEDMTARCYKKNHKSFHRYGGRGIKICESIRATPESIKRILGFRPKDHSIDRINNDGHYSCGVCSECVSKGWPQNIRWATRLQQSRNSNSVVKITISGVTKCAGEWAEESGVSADVIRHRYKNGWRGNRLLSPI